MAWLRVVDDGACREGGAERCLGREAGRQPNPGELCDPGDNACELAPEEVRRGRPLQQRQRLDEVTGPAGGTDATATEQAGAGAQQRTRLLRPVAFYLADRENATVHRAVAGHSTTTTTVVRC